MTMLRALTAFDIETFYISNSPPDQMVTTSSTYGKILLLESLVYLFPSYFNCVELAWWGYGDDNPNGNHSCVYKPTVESKSSSESCCRPQ